MKWNEMKWKIRDEAEARTFSNRTRTFFYFYFLFFSALFFSATSFRFSFHSLRPPPRSRVSSLFPLSLSHTRTTPSCFLFLFPDSFFLSSTYRIVCFHFGVHLGRLRLLLSWLVSRPSRTRSLVVLLFLFLSLSWARRSEQRERCYTQHTHTHAQMRVYKAALVLFFAIASSLSLTHTFAMWCDDWPNSIVKMVYMWWYGVCVCVYKEIYRKRSIRRILFACALGTMHWRIRNAKLMHANMYG